jgi:hypothetical protein
MLLTNEPYKEKGEFFPSSQGFPTVILHLPYSSYDYSPLFFSFQVSEKTCTAHFFAIINLHKGQSRGDPISLTEKYEAVGYSETKTYATYIERRWNICELSIK